MPEYRRRLVPGGSYFFTVCLEDRRATTLVDHVDLLAAAWRRTQALQPFASPSWVILPDHLHCIWELPDGDSDYAGRWKSLKALFSKGLRARGVPVPAGRRAGESGLWQRRFWEHVIRDQADRANHIDYIDANPYRHGLVRHLSDWPWSSWHRTHCS
jgi:putative transposase